MTVARGRRVSVCMAEVVLSLWLLLKAENRTMFDGRTRLFQLTSEHQCPTSVPGLELQ
jgi:hypothetical protein